MIAILMKLIKSLRSIERDLYRIYFLQVISEEISFQIKN